MRRAAGVLIGMVVVLAWGRSAQAGVYSTIENKMFLVDDNFRKFQDASFIPLRRVGTLEADQPWQQLYALMAAGLDVAKLRPPAEKDKDTLTAMGRLDLAVCFLRMREPHKAIEILNIANKQDRGNFLIMSTLGTAHMLVGEYQKASDWLGAANAAWGKPYAKLSPSQQELVKRMQWTAQEFSWYARCEQLQRRLAIARQRELRDKPLTYPKSLEQLDPLFPMPGDDGKPTGKPVRYVAASGKFEAGKIAPDEKAKLPKDAITMLEQLLIWMPDDMRLYWQLGEVFNAEGDANSAKSIFMEFLKKYPIFLDPKAQAMGDDKLIKLYLPKFTDQFPEVGSRLTALLNYTPPAPDVTPPPAAPPKKEETQFGSLNIDWRTLGVGFGIGLCCGVLFVWQHREVRRRRQARSGATFEPHHAAMHAERPKPGGPAPTDTRPDRHG